MSLSRNQYSVDYTKVIEKSNYIREFPVFPQLKLLMKGYVYLDKETIGYGTARAAQYGTGEIDRVMNMI
ncbi:1284_t:CDS:2 [Entrophospora sp. SA101]|nr:1284_t:CDS:2 [Entrophospora sp. SA101]